MQLPHRAGGVTDWFDEYENDQGFTVTMSQLNETPLKVKTELKYTSAS